MFLYLKTFQFFTKLPNSNLYVTDKSNVLIPENFLLENPLCFKIVDGIQSEKVTVYNKRYETVRFISKDTDFMRLSSLQTEKNNLVFFGSKEMALAYEDFNKKAYSKKDFHDLIKEVISSNPNLVSEFMLKLKSLK